MSRLRSRVYEWIRNDHDDVSSIVIDIDRSWGRRLKLRRFDIQLAGADEQSNKFG